MKATTATVLASLATAVSAGQGKGTFAVLRFNGNGFLVNDMVDPIVNPNTVATHMHGIMGGSAFSKSVTGEQLMNSKCSTAKIHGDNSAYWIPEVIYQDPTNGSLTSVPLMYMNVYYFFEKSDDDIKPFPVGLKMLSGDSKTRSPPAFGGGQNLQPKNGPVQPIQWTCPRQNYNPPSYPANSDGTTAGMQDPNNAGAGAGFPLYPCDGTYSPLRQDIHFPSCYNPAAGLDDYQNNMAWPSDAGDQKVNCPPGYTHVPHLFYEVYWDTPKFDTLWKPDGKTQPYILSTGDRTGYSSHGDFFAAWDQDVLQKIIDGCNAGSAGMDLCGEGQQYAVPGVKLNTDNNCKISDSTGSGYSTNGYQVWDKLPGNNAIGGWGIGSNPPSGGGGSGSSSAVYKPSTSTGKPASTAAYTQSTSKAAAASSSAQASTKTSATGLYTPPATKPSGPQVVGAAAVSSSQAASSFPASSKPNTAMGVAAIETSKAVVQPSSSVVAAQPSSTPEGYSTGDDSGVKVVWDVVTVYETTTQWIEPTGAAKRHVHDHAARHHGGRHHRR